MKCALCSRFNSNFSISGLNFNLLSKLSLFGHVFFSSGSAPFLLMPKGFVWVGSHLQSTQCEMAFLLLVHSFLSPYSFPLLLVRNWQELHTEMKVIKNTYHGRKKKILYAISKYVIAEQVVSSWPSRHGPEILKYIYFKKSTISHIKIMKLNIWPEMFKPFKPFDQKLIKTCLPR